MYTGLGRKLNAVEVNFPVCLAPMVGLSDVCLRLLVRHYMPAQAKTIWPTEMLSSWRIPREEVGHTPETRRGVDETGLVPQILGNEEEPIRQTVDRLQGWGAVGIDINMGCPVRKALRHNYGVALMGDPNYAAEVVRMTVRSSQLPVSVKLRAGLQRDTDYLKKFVKNLEEAGASWICLHPRAAEQKRRGFADWSQIGEVRSTISLPVIGNGDVQIADDVLNMLGETHCDLVMVGRALTARPWLVWQVGEKLGWASPTTQNGRPAPQTPYEEGEEFGKALLLYIDLLKEYLSPELGLKRLNFFMRNANSWLEYGHALMTELTRVHDLESAKLTVQQFFLVPQKMYGKTNLRY